MYLPHRRDLHAALVAAHVPAQARRSLLGMLYGRRGWSPYPWSQAAAARFLERAGVAVVDWDHCCPCGVCDPEPLLSLLRKEVQQQCV